MAAPAAAFGAGFAMTGLGGADRCTAFGATGLDTTGGF